MIYELYNKIEKKRAEIEEYIEKRIPLKKYIEKYKPIFVFIFIFIVFYLYFWAFDDSYKGSLIGGSENEPVSTSIYSNAYQKRLEEKKKKQSEKKNKFLKTSAEKLSEIERAKKIKKKIEKGQKYSNLANNNKTLLKKYKNIEKTEGKLNKSIESKLVRKQNIKNRIKYIKENSREKIQFYITSSIRNRLIPIIGYTASEFISNKIYLALYNSYYNFTSIFRYRGGVGRTILYIVSRIILIFGLISILILIIIYVPILFFLSAFFAVLKNVINLIQTKIQ
jgi:hypothetical protein